MAEIICFHNTWSASAFQQLGRVGPLGVWSCGMDRVPLQSGCQGGERTNAPGGAGCPSPVEIINIFLHGLPIYINMIAHASTCVVAKPIQPPTLHKSQQSRVKCNAPRSCDLPGPWDAALPWGRAAGQHWLRWGHRCPTDGRRSGTGELPPRANAEPQGAGEGWAGEPLPGSRHWSCA